MRENKSLFYKQPSINNSSANLIGSASNQNGLFYQPENNTQRVLSASNDREHSVIARRVATKQSSDLKSVDCFAALAKTAYISNKLQNASISLDTFIMLGQGPT